MIDDDRPILLKREDAPDPPDCQAVAIELMQTLRSLVDESHHLRSLLTRWGDNPVEVFRRAQTRSIEIHDQAATALEAGEQLVQSMRAARAFSTTYGTERGAGW